MIDDPALAASVQTELEKLQYTVMPMSEGGVLQKMFDEVPNLVIVDEDFRGGEGRLLALGIKEDVVLKYVPIILLVKNDTFFDDTDDGIDLYFRKDRQIRDLAFCAREIAGKTFNELDLNPLTRLPGTRSSILRIEGAVSADQAFSVCCIDLSDLSAFNSAYGDGRGDEIIVKVGHILQDILKNEGTKDDFVGHLGGDDFIVITTSNRSVQIAEEIIKQFDRVIPNFYDMNDRKQGYLLQRNKQGLLTQYPIMSLSVAIIQSDRTRPTEIAEIGRIGGDLKKYMKAMPGSCYISYQPHRGEEVLPTEEGSYLDVCFPSRMETVRVPALTGRTQKHVAFLNTILRLKKIKTVYQPIVDLATKQIGGYEALTRTLDDNFFSDPALLFSMARQASRVKELDKLCVDCALKTGQGIVADKKLFLNLNHETLLDSGLMKTLFSERGVIDFKSIVIEITEQSILRSFEKMRDALLELKEQGVSVAIDDVGGGAVSLRDVALLRPDYIKFDRSLIRQIDTNITKQQIVLSMILFAKGIRAKTTAEGIETREELETVKMCGVDLVQGYFLARPGPPFPALNI